MASENLLAVSHTHSHQALSELIAVEGLVVVVVEVVGEEEEEGKWLETD